MANASGGAAARVGVGCVGVGACAAWCSRGWLRVGAFGSLRGCLQRRERCLARGGSGWRRENSRRAKNFQIAWARGRLLIRKHAHVVRLQRDGMERTVACVDLDDSQGLLLQTSVSGVLQPYTTRSASRVLWRQPAMTLALICSLGPG